MKTSTKLGEIIRFCIVGCIALAVQYAAYSLLIQIWGHNVSYTIGYIVSFIVNYILTTSFTFKTKKTKKNGAGFALSHLVNYLIQVNLLNFFIYLGCCKQWAPIPVFAICVPTNFFMVRFFMKRINF